LNFLIRIRGNKSIEEWGPLPHLFTMVRIVGQGLFAGHRILSFILWIGSEKRYESAVHVLVHVLLPYIRYGSDGLAAPLFQHSLSTFTWSNSSFGNARSIDITVDHVNCHQMIIYKKEKQSIKSDFARQ
jgi:hypothetical protein